jgi:carboxymethylenebutenolidase
VYQQHIKMREGSASQRSSGGYTSSTRAGNEPGRPGPARFCHYVNHGFHNDTTPRFDPEAAKLAEERTIAFFNEHLR